MSSSIEASTARDRGILFSGPMVRALLAGKKTETRRLVKPQPAHGCAYGINGAQSHALHYALRTCDAQGNWTVETTTRGLVPPTARSKDHRLPCPYGKPGDTLWVRETWCPLNLDAHPAPRGTPLPDDRTRVQIAYRADHLDLRGDAGPMPWRSSIHMPRWASRVGLRITRVRVERVQSITLEDARAEGIPDLHGEAVAAGLAEPGERACDEWDNRATRENYLRLFDAINPGALGGVLGGGNGETWERDPWVWVVTFERVEAAR